MTEIATSRRKIMTGAAAAGVAVPILAACGDDGGTGATGTTDPTTTDDSPSSSSAPGDDGGIKTADIPEGGGRIIKSDNVVVTQPSAGEFKAFSATCTHQGCTVASVEDGTINCVCHGSRFSIEDGSVENGPAPEGLAEKTVTVSGDTLTVS